MLRSVHTWGMTEIGRAALELLLPVTCAGCGVPGEACCPECASVFAGAGLLIRGGGTHALARYEGVARRLVLAHKERGRRDLTVPLGRAFAAAVTRLPEARPAADGTWWLVPVPSRRSAARARGGSHLHALARACAAALAEDGVPVAVAPSLRLAAGTRDAVGLDRLQRAANLEGRLRLRVGAVPPPGTPVVLLDDVVTTGATLAACRRALAVAGVDLAPALTLTAA